MKTKTKTLEAFGMELPILAEIGDGWFWVQHPNGPAVANENTISTLRALFPSAEDAEYPSDETIADHKLALRATEVLGDLLRGRSLITGE